MRGAARRVVLSLALATMLSPAEGATNRLRVYPNTTIRAFALAQGPDGFLWLAAADGLYRFDGFHYHKITGYPLASARFLTFTGDGSLWAADFQGLVRLRDGRFETILTEDINGLTAYPDQIFVQPGGSLARIGLDGSVRRMNYRIRRAMSIDSSGRLWGVCLAPVEICWIDPKNPEVRHAAGDGGDFYQASPDAKGRLWIADGEHAVLLENGRTVIQMKRRATPEGNRAGPLLTGRNGRIWFLGETPRELLSGAEFRDRADHDRFAPLAGVEASDGHLWLSSSGRGLVEWIRDENWERWFPEDFSGEPAVQVLVGRGGAVLLATHKYIYRKVGPQWKRLTRDERRYDSVIPLDDGGFLAAIRGCCVARLSEDGTIVERLPDLQPGRNDYRKIVRDSKNRYWAGAKEALLRIEGRPGSLHFSRQQLPGVPDSETQQAVDLEIDKDGRLWVGYVAGVAWLDEEDRWHRIRTSEPVTTVRSIAVDTNEIWVAYRKPGVFSRLVKNGDGWDVIHYNFSPRDTYFVKRDSRGWIWRGTPNGVYVADGVHFSAGDWLHLHMGNGLAANELDQYGFFQDTDGSVWIAGEEGVTHLRPDSSWFRAPRDSAPPRVTRIESDGRVFLYTAGIPSELNGNLKTLRIDVGTLGTSPLRDVPLRWRLLPKKDWQPSADGTLEFRDLANGPYSLEVAYAGGEPFAIYSFRVGAASRWLSWLWWFVPAGLMAPFALRRSLLAKTRFRLEKTMFLLRRRFHQSAADSIPNDWSGKILNGRYRADRIVSRGGFSIVYEAADLRAPSTRIAVKVLSRTEKKDGWIRDRFAHEVSALRSIEHPGVVRVFDSWISPAGEPCLAMPFLEGQTLRQAMAHATRVDRARASALIRRIGDALGEVHARGIVHRDLKPENIMLMEDDQPVIVDFGSAGLRTADNELAETTLIAGSFHYMAPERLTGRYSPATDVYSFAVIILELVSGKRLADLRAAFSDAPFSDEVSTALGNELAGSLLAPAFDPDPRRRPAAVKEWADRIASSIARM
jgi:streptogramin lyase